VVPPASHKISRVSWYSGSQPEPPRCLLRDSHPLWSRFPTCSNNAAFLCAGPTTPTVPKDRWFGLFPVRSPLLRESRLISFCRATEMFQFTHVPPSPPMCSVGGLQTSLWRSCLIRNLGVLRLYAAPPERFAGLRVLLRSYAPRHPPRTLCSLFFYSVTEAVGSFLPAASCCVPCVNRFSHAYEHVILCFNSCKEPSFRNNSRSAKLKICILNCSKCKFSATTSRRPRRRV
jgi:hypothetical protein